ncbi:MAG: hypothetical protein AAF602_24560, partial [Myxococcota bacterium]
MSKSSFFLPLLLVGCAVHAAPQTSWLPDATGWTVRDADDGEPPRWVAYERDAQAAPVKEIRVVGVVDATPAATMRALRTRLLDPQYVPEGLDWRILEQSETE